MGWSLRTLLSQRPPKDLVAERVRLLRTLRRGGAATAMLVVSEAVGCLAPAAVALATGRLVAGTEIALADGTTGMALQGLVTLAVVLVVSQLVQTAREGLSLEVRLRIDGWVRMQVRRATAARASLLDLADPDFQNDVSRASDLGQGWRVRSVGAAAVGQLIVLTRMVGGLAVAAVLAQFSPVVAVAVLLLALINRAVLRRQWMYLAGFEDERAPLRRRTTYWGELASDPRAAGEVRLLGLGTWIAMRHRRRMLLELEPVNRERSSVMRQQTLIVVLTFAAAAIGVVPVALAAADGAITTAALVTYLTATVGALSIAAMGHEAFDIEYGRFTVQAIDRIRGSATTPTTPPPRCDHPTRDSRPAAGHHVQLPRPAQPGAGPPRPGATGG